MSNSLLEMYVLQHYLQPERLEELGLHSADAWAATFVEFQTSVEVTPDGSGFRLKRRPAKFENVPELLTLFGEVADLRPPELVRRPAPGRPASQRRDPAPVPQLRAYVASLAERADRLRQVDAHEDNMLKICGDGRKAALDLGLVGIATARPGKVGAVIANVARIYHADPGAGPARRRPGRTARRLPDRVLRPGHPQPGRRLPGLRKDPRRADRRRRARRADPVHPRRHTDLRKAALFADCRAGQGRGAARLHRQARRRHQHPDPLHRAAPRRRALAPRRRRTARRPCAAARNLNASVEIFRYVSEKSFDSFMWQTLERKARFIGQVLGGRTTGRDVDDIGDATLSYAEVKALATGNPLLLELAEANAEVTRLRQLATGHTRAIRRLTESVTSWQQQISARTRLADTCERIAATAARPSRP